MPLQDSALKVLGAALGAGDPFGVHYQFQCQDDATEWEVRTMTMDHSLREPYALRLELVTDGMAPGPDAMLGKDCSLELERAGDTTYIHGIISSVGYGGSHNLKAAVIVTIRPALWALSIRRDTRIFQNRTVPEVLELMLKEGLGRHGRDFKLPSLIKGTRYPQREYIVQYQETDLEFVHRLMAEEGIWYHFDFPDGLGKLEELVLHDTNEDLADIVAQEGSIVVDLDASGVMDHEVVNQFVEVQSLLPAGHHVRQYDWTNPTLPAEGRPTGAEASALICYEHDTLQVFGYDTGQRKYLEHNAPDQARLYAEQVGAQVRVFEGTSNLLDLGIGKKLKISGHPQGLDGDYLITSVHYGGQQAHEEQREEGDYDNTFTCIPFETPYRPRREPRPRVHGVVSALVVGPDSQPSHESGGDAIHVDEWGRVRVRFAWDRYAEDEPNDVWPVQCYLRVMQPWAGTGFGSQLLPRIGTEVVVSFLDGNPDRPIIVGSVYHGGQDYPYPLTEARNKNILAIKSQSNPKGEGFNELRFDDNKDEEELFLHAQRDMNEVVEKDHSTTVHGSQTNSVDGSQTESIGGDQTCTVKKTRTDTIHGMDTLKVVDGSDRLVEVAGNETKRITKSRTLEVTQGTEETYTGGRKVIVKSSEVMDVLDGAHKNDHVTGQYNITADEHFKVTQGGDELFIKEQVYVKSGGDIQLKNSGFHLTAGNGGKTTLNVGSELTITVGSSSITLKSDGTIEISGPTSVKVMAMQGAFEGNAQGATVSGLKATLSGTAMAEVTGAIVKVN